MHVCALLALQFNVTEWPIGTELGFDARDTCGCAGPAGVSGLVDVESPAEDSPQPANAAAVSASASATRNA